MYGALGTDELLDENAPLRPLTAYAESKVRAEEGLAELADHDFVSVSDAERDRLRRVARGFGSTSCSTTSRLGAHDGPDPAALGRDGRGVRSSTSETSPRSRSPCSRPPTTSFAARRSTSARPSRTTSSATSRRCSPMSPDARSSSQPTRRPTRGRIGSTSPSSRVRSPRSGSTGTPGAGAEELSARTAPYRSPRSCSRAGGTSGCDSFGTCSIAGALEEGPAVDRGSRDAGTTRRHGRRALCRDARSAGATSSSSSAHEDERGFFARVW